MRSAKSTSVGITKSTRTKKSANIDINKSAIAETNKSAINGTEHSVNIVTVKAANVGTKKSANVVTNKSAKVGTIKSATVGPTKGTKASKTTKRGKNTKSPERRRKLGTVRKGKRVVSLRNAKKTTIKTKTKRESRSLGNERNKKGVNGTTVIAPGEVKGEHRKHVEDDTDLSEDNAEDTAPLAETKSSPKQNGTVEENGQETDSDSIRSCKDEQLTHDKTVAFAGSDSDTQDADHESNMHIAKIIGTVPRELDNDTGSATGAGNESSYGSDRSCTPLSNYIANDPRKGCKITIKKTSNGFISGNQCGVSSRQHGQSGDCLKKAKSRKSFVSESVAKTVIACEVVADYKTDGPTVNHDIVSQIKSDTNTEIAPENKVGGPDEFAVSNIVSVCKTDETVVDGPSCTQEIFDVISRCKSDTDVHDVASRFETDAPPVDDATSDCEIGASGELTIAEPEHDEERDPETNAVAPEKMDICADVSVVSTEGASSNAPGLIFNGHIKDTDPVSLLADENDQSFAKPERENQEIDTAEKSPSELLGPSDDDTEVRNNNVTSPTAPGEPIRLVYYGCLFRCPYATTISYKSRLYINGNNFVYSKKYYHHFHCCLYCGRETHINA